jgi:Tol biopolymer transport system component
LAREEKEKEEDENMSCPPQGVGSCWCHERCCYGSGGTGGRERACQGSLPGSNGAIAFDDSLQVYRMNSDVFGQTKLSDSPLTNFQPDWSADGKKIAFSNFNSANNTIEVYWMNSDGLGETNLTQDAAFDSDPAFFPNHHKIVFTSTRDGDSDIFKMTVNDSGDIIGEPTKLTTSTALDFNPTVSPDGKKIAFVSDRGAGFDTDIYVMKANAPESATNKAVKLTRSAADDSYPEWSPNGQRIAFDSDRSGNSEVYVMKANAPESSTNRPKNLTNNSAEDAQPTFSPDGMKIAFVSNRTELSLDIFKMKVDGSGAQVNLTNNKTAWRPRRSPPGNLTPRAERSLLRTYLRQRYSRQEKR